MPEEKALVRLVPQPARGDFFDRTLRTFRWFLPDPERGLAALELLIRLGFHSWRTPLWGVEGEIPVEKVEEIFRVRVVAEESGRLRTDEPLQIPDVLKGLIAFAYLPSPPELYAPSAIPPATETFHLRLEDMAMVLGASRCHRQGWTGKDVLVAVVDTGFAPHPYFEQHGYRISRIGHEPTLDPEGHGTGISANVLAVAPDCHLLGSKYIVSAAGGMDRALAQGPRVIGCSWGWDLDEENADKISLFETDPNRFYELEEIELLVKLATKRKTAVLFAAGNGQRSVPGSMKSVMSVGGVTVDAQGSLRASNFASAFKSSLFSDKDGDRFVPDFCGVVGEVGDGGPAPGHIMLPVPEFSDWESENMGCRTPGWGIFSGTSAAVPQLVGVCALLLQINPELGHDELRSVLSSTCRDVVGGNCYMDEEAVKGPDLATGAGFVDAYAACQLVAAGLSSGDS